MNKEHNSVPDTRFTLQDLAMRAMKEHPDQYRLAPIILAAVDGKLMELGKSVQADTSIRFITTEDPTGRMALVRTTIFSMLKAFFAQAGRSNVRTITVDFQIQDALFVRPAGHFQLDEQLLDGVARRMQEYAQNRYPIHRRRVLTQEAIQEFSRYRMDSKARLFRYRLSGTVHIYSLGNFVDYFYGHMAPDAGYVKNFRLIPWDDGFFLQIPRTQEETIFDPAAHEKEYATLRESHIWAQKLDCEDVADLNGWICKGQASTLIGIQEALQEKKIGQIAESIALDGNRRIVMIAGPSSSSKTTFAKRLCVQLQALGLNPVQLSVDDWFKNREDSPRLPDGSYDFESLEAVDLDQLNRDLEDLLTGQPVMMPVYNFLLGKREYHGRILCMNPGDVLVIEGIHALNPRMAAAIEPGSQFRIYISALTQLAIDQHNPIPPEDGRLLRRIVRDARTRGYSAEQTMEMWPAVRAGEEVNILPFQENADVFFNSACVYELAVLKQYAEPLLFDIQPSSLHYEEARRLLKFLDYFLGISSEDIPKNSLLREFIG
ncbi:nucleoside kinase [Faecalibaculum rodentium]|uniref:nucleoside kinase n=1 Tax=Faecalibaculum rodentium TaxID=1702221 RepID=UPI0023F34BBA|nr:nucleoside kinase [Faecalibaculum rodentium]